VFAAARETVADSRPQSMNAIAISTTTKLTNAYGRALFFG
jgi:hypothetical protein